MRSSRVGIHCGAGLPVAGWLMAGWLEAGLLLACGGAQQTQASAAAPGQGSAAADLAALREDDAASAPNSPEFEQGVAAIREEKFDLARERFDQVVAAQPRNAQAVLY